MSDRTPLDVLSRAEQEYTSVRGEIIRLAREHWSEWVPNRPLPNEASAGSPEAADRETVRRVLDAIGRIHPPAEDLLEFCRAELARVEAFVSTHDLIGLATEPLEIRWTPAFQRAFGGAMLDSPGPLTRARRRSSRSRRSRRTGFIGADPRPARTTTGCSGPTIHEAVPGHYLQGVYANRSPSIARAIFWSGTFAEGWAVYVTQVMMDVGYGADDPALMLTHWKFYLRSVTNAIIDVRIHMDLMTEDEAMRLMIDGGFQEESEARNKWNRARLTSTQLSTYFIGSIEMWDLERRARRVSRRPRATRAASTPYPNHGSSATTGIPPGSSIAGTWKRSSRTGRRRSRCCDGSCSATWSTRPAPTDRPRVRLAGRRRAASDSCPTAEWFSWGAGPPPRVALPALARSSVAAARALTDRTRRPTREFVRAG